MPLDLLLVNPVFLQDDQAEREMMSPYFPLGLLYLAAFLRERGFSTSTCSTAPFRAAWRIIRPRCAGMPRELWELRWSNRTGTLRCAWLSWLTNAARPWWWAGRTQPATQRVIFKSPP